MIVVVTEGKKIAPPGYPARRFHLPLRGYNPSIGWAACPGPWHAGSLEQYLCIQHVHQSNIQDCILGGISANLVLDAMKPM